MQRIALFVVTNGIAMLMGQVMVFYLPEHDIPKTTIIILCAWNYLLGRLVDRSFRHSGT